jgi:hypothetical protein
MADYSVGNAPGGANYAAPLVGFQFGQALSGLPEQYMQGREQARKTQMEDMFRDPASLPRDPVTNKLDVNAIIEQGARIGGLPFVQQMIPFLNDQLINRQVVETLGGTDQRAGVSYGAPSPPPNAAGPAAVTARPQVASADAYGDGPLINQVIAQHFGPDGPQVDQSDIKQLASRLNIDPNKPLNPRQVQQVKNALGSSGSTNQETQPPLKGTSAYEAGVNAKPLPASGVSGAAAPPSGGFSERFAAGEPQRGIAPGISVQEAQRLEDTGTNQLKASVAAGAMSKPNTADKLKALGEANLARAKQMRDQLGEAYKFTGPEKEARDLAVQNQKRQEEVQKADIKISNEKTYPGVQALGQAGKISNDKIDRMRVQMSDPNFFSGAGHEIAQKFKEWSVTLGGNPRAADPMQEMGKTISQMLTDDIKAMGASGAGPVRVAEVQNMQRGIAGLKLSPSTNRYLLEELYRVHNDNMQVARLAQQYKSDPRGPGYLDAGWDKIRDQYYRDHPLFDKDELADPRLVAPPLLTKEIDANPAKRKAWEKAQGLQYGDPIKLDIINPKTGKPKIVWKTD